LALEQGTLLAGHDTLGDRDAELRAQLLIALDAVIARLGPAGMHLSRIDALLLQPLEGRWSARLRAARARVLRDRGEMDACVEELERARATAEAGTRAAIGVELGEALLGQGRFDDAARTLQSVLDESAQDRRAQQRALGALGLVHHSRGRLDEAEARYAEA